MRVKISKTVDLVQVPDEFDSLLDSVSSLMYNLQNNIESTIPQYSVETHEECVKQIMNIREKLVLLDANLEDAIGMIDGYKKIVEGKDAVSSNADQQPV
jgi:hypothetical protein